MSKIYFIADIHFGHQKIINYESRPFESVDEMDGTIIQNWNEIIQEDDVVYILGDYSFYDFEHSKEITSQLKGKKYLVMGNHDEEDESVYRQMGFVNAYRFPIILNNFWILSHEPVYINKNMPYANIFGHVHGCNIYSDASAQSFCSCVERLNYSPIEFEEVKKIIMGAVHK